MPLPIFVIDHAPERGSAARQLNAWRLAYETIDVAETARQSVSELMEAHGEQIFRPFAPRTTMTPEQVAIAFGHRRVYDIMAERDLDCACIVAGEAELSPAFPLLLRSRALLKGDWDVLLLAHRSRRRQRAGAGARPSPWTQRIVAGHRVARPAEFPGGATACVLKRAAIRRLARFAWPIRLPAAVLLAHSRMTGLDVRILTPPCVALPCPAADIDKTENAIKHAFYPPPVVDLMDRLSSRCQSPQAWSVYPTTAEALPSKGVKRSFRRPQASIDGGEVATGALAAFARNATGLWRYLSYRRGKLAAAVSAARADLANLLRRTAILLGAPLPPPDPGVEPLAPSPRPIPFRTRRGATAKPPPSIAVVVPTRNRRHLLAATLASLRCQTLEPRRLIVVDDGSDDGTARAVQEQFAAGGLPFETELVVQEERRGAAVARNAGLARTGDCEFVWFLDSDDFPPRNFLDKTSSCLQEHPAAVAASTDRVIRHGNQSRFFSLQPLAPDPRPWFFDHGTVVGSCTLFRTDVVRQLGGFDEALPTGHDTALFMRLADRGPWLHVPGSPVMFLQQDFHPHLKQGYDDWQRRSAAILEACLDDPGVDAAVSEELRVRVLCNRWYTAGRQLSEQGRWQEAADCFRRSLAWQRRFGRAWFYLLVSNFGAFRQAGSRTAAAQAAMPTIPHIRDDTRSSNST